MSRTWDRFVEIRVMLFPQMFPTTPKTCRSDINSSSYCGKTLKNNLQQSVRFTNFEIKIGMSHNCYKFVEIRIVGLPLTFSLSPKTRRFDIGSSRYPGKTQKQLAAIGLIH